VADLALKVAGGWLHHCLCGQPQAMNHVVLNHQTYLIQQLSSGDNSVVSLKAVAVKTMVKMT